MLAIKPAARRLSKVVKVSPAVRIPKLLNVQSTEAYRLGIERYDTAARETVTGSFGDGVVRYLSVLFPRCDRGFVEFGYVR
jgi:hypothetical protein